MKTAELFTPIPWLYLTSSFDAVFVLKTLNVLSTWVPIPPHAAMPINTRPMLAHGIRTTRI